MNYTDVNGKLADYRRQIADIRERMRDTLATVEPQQVEDYEFATIDPPASASNGTITVIAAAGAPTYGHAD